MNTVHVIYFSNICPSPEGAGGRSLLKFKKDHPLNPPPAGDNMEPTHSMHFSAICPPLEGVQGVVMDNTRLYNKRLQIYANKLRKEMTKAEASLWKYVLRSGQMKGYYFRRQRPVLEYIADFMCKELMLIIEVDGITHHKKENINKDRKRDIELIRAGFRVIRFTDEDILTSIPSVARSIELVIDEITRTTPLIPRRRGT
jgi:very-short-patch-repair endonuclease